MGLTLFTEDSRTREERPQALGAVLPGEREACLKDQLEALRAQNRKIRDLVKHDPAVGWLEKIILGKKGHTHGLSCTIRHLSCQNPYKFRCPSYQGSWAEACGIIGRGIVKGSLVVVPITWMLEEPARRAKAWSVLVAIKMALSHALFYSYVPPPISAVNDPVAQTAPSSLPAPAPSSTPSPVAPLPPAPLPVLEPRVQQVVDRFHALCSQNPTRALMKACLNVPLSSQGIRPDLKACAPASEGTQVNPAGCCPAGTFEAPPYPSFYGGKPFPNNACFISQEVAQAQVCARHFKPPEHSPRNPQRSTYIFNATEDKCPSPEK